ncbi:MAG: hypothetical protein QXS91_02815, partial [Candidatus Anstonellales archaeon]
DAVGGKSVKILNELGLLKAYEKEEHFDINGVIFSSPKGKILKVENKNNKNGPAGYIVRRFIGDNHLFNAVKENCDVIEEASVIDVLKDDKGNVIGLKAQTKDGVKDIYANVVIGADGASSIVAAKTDAEKIDDEHHVIALRQYWQGVEGMEDKIELHFMDN